MGYEQMLPLPHICHADFAAGSGKFDRWLRQHPRNSEKAQVIYER